jgi:hypothetical protein
MAEGHGVAIVEQQLSWGSTGPPRTQPDWRRAPPQTTEVGVVIAIGPIGHDLADLRAPNAGRTIPPATVETTLFLIARGFPDREHYVPPADSGRVYRQELVLLNHDDVVTLLPARGCLRIPPGNFGPGPVSQP